MKNVGEKTFLFLIGYFLYSMLEIIWRGFTHWTMAITGGICLVIIYYIAVNFEEIAIWKQALMGATAITLIEFTVGIIDNIIFHWNVWDYSNMPMNIMGQICIPFTALWFTLCIPTIFLCRKIKRHIFSNHFHYNINEGVLSSMEKNNLDTAE